ncbi:RAxF-45 family protein [Paenibacillus sp. PK3_47]|uniref:RAxF-45 family protein n=1 Tax=Paenibacillus sp. PK3_47 TaxID=2072642 RepID=UPI003183BB9F
MDHNVTNSVNSRLINIMSGIVHVFADNGRSLSIYKNLITLHNCEMPFLPTLQRT